MKTVIEMARDAGCYAEMGLTAGNMTAALERFAALVREDEREKQQEPVAWYGLVMEAAAELELASYAIQQDSDSKSSALNAATWVREQAKKLRSANPQTAAQEPRNFGIEMLKQYERGVKLHKEFANHG